MTWRGTGREDGSAEPAAATPVWMRHTGSILLTIFGSIVSASIGVIGALRTGTITRAMAEALPVDREQAFWSGVDNARRFFIGEADVQRALERLARVLEEKGIPYAVIGAMALNEWGYRRVTIGVDILLSADGLAALRAEVLGRGYYTSRNSPEAAACATRRPASTWTWCWPATRVELIRQLSLPRQMAESLDPSVRAKYEELWQAAQTAERE